MDKLPDPQELEGITDMEALVRYRSNAKRFERAWGRLAIRADELIIAKVADMTDYAREQEERRLSRIGVPFPSDPDN